MLGSAIFRDVKTGQILHPVAKYIRKDKFSKWPQVAILGIKWKVWTYIFIFCAFQYCAPSKNVSSRPAAKNRRPPAGVQNGARALPARKPKVYMDQKL